MTDQRDREPTPEELRSAAWVPGFEIPSTVTKHRSVIMTRGLQPEDLGVLDWLKLRDPRKPATQEILAAEMQAHGWKMGMTRFSGIFRRLKDAGHIEHASEFDKETGRPAWFIRFYMEPPNNPQYVDSGISAFSQVNAESSETRDSKELRAFESSETGVSQGQKGSVETRDSGGNPRKPGIPSEGVLAGQARNPGNVVFGASPPHPPEEVTTSSPNPLTSTPGRSPVLSQTEGEEAGYAEEDLKAAADLLQVLPEPWTQGKLNAGRLAPKLLAVMAEQGWPGIHTVDRVVLTKQLTKNPHKVTNPYRLLASDRVPNLPRYGVVASALPVSQGGTPDMCPDHPQYRAGRRCIPCRMA